MSSDFRGDTSVKCSVCSPFHIKHLEIESLFTFMFTTLVAHCSIMWQPPLFINKIVCGLCILIPMQDKQNPLNTNQQSSTTTGLIQYALQYKPFTKCFGMKGFSSKWDDINRFVYGIKIPSASLKHKWLDVFVETMWNDPHEVLTKRLTESHGGPHPWFYLLVLLLKDVWGLLKFMFSYTVDESSFVILQQHAEKRIIFELQLCNHMFNNDCKCSTYTEEEREDVMLVLDRELVIWGYLMLEYSLSFILFLCKKTT